MSQDSQVVLARASVTFADRVAPARPGSFDAEPPRNFISPSDIFDAAGYLAHMGMTNDKEAVLDAALDEYSQRRDAGQRVDVAAFCRKFPNFEHSLFNLLHAQSFLHGEQELLSLCDQLPVVKEGSHFLGFELQEELGRGTFARVFLATEPLMGYRRVAVKIAAKGAYEARTLGPLVHSNIVPVHGVREDPASKLTALYMPYLGRATLCDVLDRVFAPSAPEPRRARVLLEAAADPICELHETPDPVLLGGSYVDGVIHLGAQLADALAVLHAKDLLHGDLKLTNVLLTPAGKPMLLDFNLTHKGNLSEPQICGTLPYMAPEELLAVDKERKPRPPRPDGRADVYALGVILFELLTGEHPLAPLPSQVPLLEACELLHERQRHEIQLPKRVRGLLGSKLARLLLRCMANDAQIRPSAAELAAELRSCLSLSQRTLRQLRQHIWAATLASVLVLGLTVSVAAMRPSYGERFAAGLKCYQAKDFESAITAFTEAAGDADLKAKSLFARARARQQLAKQAWLSYHACEEPGQKMRLKELVARYVDSAVEDYLELDPAHSKGPVQASIAFCFSMKGSHDDALGYYDLALRLGHATGQLLNDRAFSAIQRSQFLDAKENLEEARLRNPDLDAIRLNRQELESRSKKWNRPAPPATERLLDPLGEDSPQLIE
jgi:serine/threonine protein kinase